MKGIKPASISSVRIRMMLGWEPVEGRAASGLEAPVQQYPPTATSALSASKISTPRRMLPYIPFLRIVIYLLGVIPTLS
jgi:hypothetical protein